MNTACLLLLSVISSLLRLTSGLDLGHNACSALVSGVLYGSFSLRDIFPTISAGCSWTLENPDPTKYSLYLKFNREEQVCTHFSPMVLSLDHYLSNQSCTHVDYVDYDGLELCESRTPFTFLHFDKNFVQLCLTTEPESVQFLTEDMLEFHFVELVLINNDNSSQFTCGVLCRWFEDCLRVGDWSHQCGIMQNGCICPDIPRWRNASVSNVILTLSSNDCCVTELHSGNANGLNSGEVMYGTAMVDDQKVKTQRPRSADKPGIFMAQTGDPAAEEWTQWSVCSLTCGQGWQVRTRSCVSSPYGTLCSGPLRETRICNNTATCPVHGLWEEWSSWSLCSVTCGRGSRTRTRICIVPQHGDKACEGPEEHTKPCNLAVCPADGKWGSWNQWSMCSKTCDSGRQRRTRMCQGTGVQGYPCEGSGEESRICNEKKCPALHEMCKDEHIPPMTWKKTAAGEVVYNKCPANATGSASRRCLLNADGVAYWDPPSFARCISHDYRYLHISLREHLAKGQRTAAGIGMSQIVRSLWELFSRKTYFSGDLLFSVEILRNVTDTFKRATYIPAFDDVQRFFQIVSYMLEAENKEKWDDAQQVYPGSVNLMKVVEDFIHLIGDALKPFQSSLIVTDNLVISIQREPVSAVSSDINFPMKGRRGMKEWARYSDDKLFIPKEVFSLSSSEWDESAHFVIGTVLYRTLGLILPPPKTPLIVSSRVMAVTVRPLPKSSESTVAVELSPVLNGTSEPQCVTWDYSKSDAGTGNWDTEGCQTVLSHSSYTKCLCNQLSTFAVLAQEPKDLVMDPSGTPSLPLMIGCAVSCMALLILLAVYAAFWRFIKSERSIILLNFCLSILASNVFILVGQSQTLGKGLCATTAAFLHFFFLSSFCWVLTEAWQSYLAVIGKLRTRLIRKRFLCLGWGLPALIVAISVGFTRAKGYGTINYCWLSLEGGLLYAFVGPAAVIVLVNMLFGIVVFNKLMSRDGISDKSKKQRAGASLWSSCVVLPLLALTWMSAVLAITDRRSILFQVLFAVFDSVQGFVIITVHCFLRREVQDAVKCRFGVCKGEGGENSPDSCKNGQVQIMTDFEKDVDLACQTAIFKEVNTCNPATITGTLSRISLDDEDDAKLNTSSEGVNFSNLPGNVAPTNILLQIPKMGHSALKGINKLTEQTVEKDINTDSRGPLYHCTENNLRPIEINWARTQDKPIESDYMVLPRRTVSLKPFIKDEGKLKINTEEIPCVTIGHRPMESEAYPSFVSVDHININLNQPYGTLKHPHGLQFKQHPSVRQILASELSEKSRTMPRSTQSSSSASVGSLERKRLRYSDLDFEKVMHTRKRHSELYHELNQKFHTLDRYSRKRASYEDKPSVEEKQPWQTYRAMTLNTVHSEPKEKLELHSTDWEKPSTIPLDLSEGDFQTEV
ncbi:adhesion G protein-coupled receptor B2 isoform X2 [Protopterus annectens]|uniref:adhesion G protein-coupled receptor B2 isoform X2 n=1 Tax=Protopterus annectens TaxID=7888 RepID=UPI001CF93B7D|nr:adhesion G protein-coupled receptor B2 isoform X2 [Protopterus annectens]